MSQPEQPKSSYNVNPEDHANLGLGSWQIVRIGILIHPCLLYSVHCMPYTEHLESFGDNFPELLISFLQKWRSLAISYSQHRHETEDVVADVFNQISSLLEIFCMQRWRFVIQKSLAVQKSSN